MAKKTPIRGEIISFRCYPEEKKRIEKAAKQAKKQRGDFVKDLVMEEVRRVEFLNRRG